jgi:hypothetical protein
MPTHRIDRERQTASVGMARLMGSEGGEVNGGLFGMPRIK